MRSDQSEATRWRARFPSWLSQQGDSDPTVDFGGPARAAWPYGQTFRTLPLIVGRPWVDFGGPAKAAWPYGQTFRTLPLIVGRSWPYGGFCPRAGQGCSLRRIIPYAKATWPYGETYLALPLITGRPWPYGGICLTAGQPKGSHAGTVRYPLRRGKPWLFWPILLDRHPFLL